MASAMEGVVGDKSGKRAVPNLELAQWRFALAANADDICPDRAHVQTMLRAEIIRNNMVPFYELVAAETGIVLDDATLSAMNEANVQRLAKIEQQLKDAEENAGESEIREAYAARAEHYALVGDKALALEWHNKAFSKSVGAGMKLDVYFSIIRIALFFRDTALTASTIDRARTLCDEGGDWDRRNRLKVYEGLYLMSVRNLKRAAELFIDTLPTFTCTELMSYKTYVRYTIICALVTQDRVALKKTVINSPEVLEVMHELDVMDTYLNAFYEGRYKEFFLALAHVEMLLKRDRYMNAHYRYYVREMRIRAYAQLLESYKSVTLASMAEAFGVTVDFIDRELSRFIFGGRVNCVIDKVAGIVETNRPDAKNAQYQATIKQGDLLLNRVQKLSRVINL